MAKVTNPLHSLDASGSFARLLLFGHNKQQQTVRSIAGLRLAKFKGTSRNPSPQQVYNRASYSARIAQWHSATHEEREEYRALAEARGWTLFNAWMSDRPPLPEPQQGTLWDDGATTWDGGATTFDI